VSSTDAPKPPTATTSTADILPGPQPYPADVQAPVHCGLEYLYWLHLQPSHSSVGATRTTAQPLLKPRYALDCPACTLFCANSSVVRPEPFPVRPWLEMKRPVGEFKRRRVARLIRPSLEVCRLSRAVFEQDAQHLLAGHPPGQSSTCRTPCHLWNLNNVSTEKGVSEAVPRIPDSAAKLSDEPALASRNGRAPSSRAQRIVVISLWVLGFIILAGLGVLVHFHTAPWPFELAFTKSLQGPHPIPCLRLQQPRSALEAAFFDVSLLNNPLPSVIGGAVWVAGMLLLRLWRQAITFVLAVASVGGLFLFLTPLVGRPRPTINYGICVHDHYAYFSFPSGHVSHDVVCYGFLLYVTLSEPV
jgi:hypothetical protein